MNIRDYPLETANANLAEITLIGRYPENGYALNTVSEMMVYVLQGEVVLYLEDSETLLREKDAVLVDKNKKYFWQPNPAVTLLIFSTPPWTKEQQEMR
jgi:mannose-6-phosphate isomerase-like protein (cupin superfamily)